MAQRTHMVQSHHELDEERDTVQYIYDFGYRYENGDLAPVAEVYGREIILLEPFASADNAKEHLRDLEEKVVPWRLPGYSADIPNPRKKPARSSDGRFQSQQEPDNSQGDQTGDPLPD